MQNAANATAKLHQISYRKFKNPISNYRIEQQPFHTPPKKEIQRCNIPEVIPGSQCFQAWLDFLHKGLCVRNRMKQFLIFRVGLDGNIKQIAAYKFDTAEVPADPAKIANHFFKLLLTFFSQQLRYASGLFFAMQNTYSSGSSLKIFSTSWQSWLQSCRNSRSACLPFFRYNVIFSARSLGRRSAFYRDLSLLLQAQ